VLLPSFLLAGWKNSFYGEFNTLLWQTSDFPFLHRNKNGHSTLGLMKMRQAGGPNMTNFIALIQGALKG